jgi:ABC-type transport system substrate-binding protein
MLRSLAAGAAVLALVAGSLSTPARAGGTLRVGMTAADIPLSWGQPDQGFEGFRFMGLMLYDALINWDMSSADDASGLIPGLAESWEVNEADKTRWTFRLRKGAKFHDGSDFDADAVLWNFDRLFDKDSPQYSARMASLVNFRIPSLAYDPDTNAKGWQKIDSHTVEFTTKSPDSFFPYQVCYILMSSPARFAEAGGDWNKFAENPSGTGPWQLVELVPRERAEFVPFADHWDPMRQPKLDKVITIPLPDPNARTAALLSGQVDWIEAPSPDAIPRLVERGMVISSNLYPHVWSWHLSRVEGSPWNDVRVRKAANLAIDRDGIVALLGGYGIQAKGHVSPADPWYGSPSFELRYDPDAAKALLAEAGYPNGFQLTIHGPNNRYVNDAKVVQAIAQMFTRVGIRTEVDTMPKNVFFKRASNLDFSVNLQGWGSTGEASSVLRGIIYTYDKETGMGTFNVGRYSNPKVDALVDQSLVTVDDDERAALLARATELAMADYALIVTHYQLAVWATRKDLQYLPRTDEMTIANGVTSVQ